MRTWQAFLAVDSDDIKEIRKFLLGFWRDLGIFYPKADPFWNDQKKFKKEQKILKGILEKISRKENLLEEDIKKINEELANTYQLLKPKFGATLPPQVPPKLPSNSYLLAEVQLVEEVTPEGEIFGTKSSTMLGFIYIQISYLIRNHAVLNKCMQCSKFFIPKRKNQLFCNPKCRNLYNYYKSARKKI